MQRLRNKCGLPKTLLREIEKADDLIDSGRKKFRQDGRGGFRGKKVDKETYGDSVRTFRQGGKFQKKSPEQILDEAVRQTRAGECSHCNEEGHFYRECPTFWDKVKESRKANKK